MHAISYIRSASFRAGAKEIGSVPFSMKASCGVICVESPEGGYNNRVKVGGP
jgi:hypothetical protein